MFDRTAALKLLRAAAIFLGVAGDTIYIAIFALLFVYQRDMLFVRGRVAEAPDAIYRVRNVAEADGTRLTVWEAPAARAGAPVIVFFYGNAGTLSDFAGVGDAFHDEGYGIVLASYRGYSGNPGSPSEMGLMDDARAILASLGTDHGPIVLWGQSLGTGVAARMAAEGRGAALILQSPYTAVADVAARLYPMFPVRLAMRDSFDTASLVPRIHVPVLIMSGTVDRTVPFDMAQTLAHRLGTQARFVPLPGQGHDLSAYAVQEIADKWLRMHKPTAP
jgi:pimeloyl-ACP methyl ester carboxylesterase